jgi:single-strand DNA-binding protein
MRPVFLSDSLQFGYTLPMSVNKAILVGRLGRDPETRFTSGGQAVANFTLATDETFKDRSGERQKRTEWHRIVLWGKLAEISQQYLKKGMLVYIEGRIQTRQWEDKRDGQKKTTTEIVANVMRMLTSRAESGAISAQARSADIVSDAVVAPDESAQSGPEISDEDIPF